MDKVCAARTYPTKSGVCAGSRLRHSTREFVQACAHHHRSAPVSRKNRPPIGGLFEARNCGRAATSVSRCSRERGSTAQTRRTRTRSLYAECTSSNRRFTLKSTRMASLSSSQFRRRAYIPRRRRAQSRYSRLRDCSRRTGRCGRIDAVKGYRLAGDIEAKEIEDHVHGRGARTIEARPGFEIVCAGARHLDHDRVGDVLVGEEVDHRRHDGTGERTHGHETLVCRAGHGEVQGDAPGEP